MDNNQSEIARLRQQIEDETRSMQQALTGYSTTARHDIVANKYKALDHYHQELIGIVGEEQAIEIVFDAYQSIIG